MDIQNEITNLQVAYILEKIKQLSSTDKIEFYENLNKWEMEKLTWLELMDKIEEFYKSKGIN